MKTCPVCALDLEDTYLFCPDDGSILNSLPGRLAEHESASAAEPKDETAGAVVLYCPACAAEYPLTFSSCPVHGMKLTKHPIPRSPKIESAPRKPGVESPATVDGRQLQQDLSQPTTPLATLGLGQPRIDTPNLVAPAADEADSDIDAINNIVESPASDAFAGGVAAFGYQESESDAHERKLERPGFRVAAIATVIALALFALVALYTIVSNLSRPSLAAKNAGASRGAPQPLPFVATPQEARDYKEEAPVAPSTPIEEPTEQAATRAHRESSSSSSPPQDLRKNTEARQSPPPQPAPVTTRVSSPPMPDLPRGNSGGFDARLIRVRSRKTPAGVRYDLTFNMQEQGGRAAHWQRVLVNTRSASGASHSQAIPFSHRLGATGALTFTISVEMTGRAEADWQGRVFCTTLGWDNKGAPLQASFGANVTP